MRVRHRIPSIFNISMVDVMCCALGCVILLWLLNLRQAKEDQAKAAKDGSTATAERTRLENEKSELHELVKRLAAELETTRTLAASLTGTLEATRNELKEARAAAEKRGEELRAQLTTSEKRAADLNAQLKTADKNDEELRAQIAATTKRGEELSTQLAAARKRGEDLSGQLAAAERLAKDLQTVADLVPGLKDQLQTSKGRMAELQKEGVTQSEQIAETMKLLEEMKAKRTALERALKLQNEDLRLARITEEKLRDSELKAGELLRLLEAAKTTLGTTNRDLATLRNEKRLLEADVVRFRQAADNRFAGITLTGRRVIFLVDMSGSMELVDEKTPSPLKWVEVRNTLLKVLKSLPDLEKFQVLVFSEDVSYLLGKPDEWHDFDPKLSPARVEAAMKSLKPRGGTNMYTALEATFHYRPRGLDTVYLLSDGLPNIGAGVPVEEARKLLEQNKEPELSERLAKHIRQTLKTNWNRDNVTSKVRINAIGFFYESPDVGAFLWALARENEGSFVGMSKP